MHKSCQKIFDNIYKMYDHLRAHTDERPFKCSYGCGRGFSQIGNRNKHNVFIHGQEKKFQCKLCNDMNFKYKYNLQ